MVFSVNSKPTISRCMKPPFSISCLLLLTCVRATAQSPYPGPSNPGVDVSTLTGKVMCGYQGWHAAQGDGLGRGWYHWQHGGALKPGQCSFDLWPAVSELDA